MADATIGQAVSVKRAGEIGFSADDVDGGACGNVAQLGQVRVM
jgi:hypothetical protein